MKLNCSRASPAGLRWQETGLCVILGIPAAIMSPEQCLTHNERLINFGDSH